MEGWGEEGFRTRIDVQDPLVGVPRKKKRKEEEMTPIAVEIGDQKGGKSSFITVARVFAQKGMAKKLDVGDAGLHLTQE